MTGEQLATLYRLREMLDAGEITEAQYDAACASIQGRDDGEDD
jgi:hypothetical protein